MAENLFSFAIDEDLRRDELDAVFPAGLGVFPDIVKHDLDLFLGYSAAISFMIGCICLAWECTCHGAELDERDQVFGKVQIQISSVTRTVPLARRSPWRPGPPVFWADPGPQDADPERQSNAKEDENSCDNYRTLFDFSSSLTSLRPEPRMRPPG